ncbi:hypothetical protein BKA62DRAFT_757738 [Auriculariales sp. MPI-PUGE-AT-0066]|nr:hypothetical protein BKA62DRAFT_757738 [Auriculariales sp. MPI-PUGE-AT-0066]
MQPMLVAVLLSLLALLAGRARAELTLFDDTDVRFEWQPEQVLDRATCTEKTNSTECTGHWWTEGTADDHWSTIHETRGPNSSVSFTFTGSEFRVYGPKFVVGGFASVVIDGVKTGMINGTSTEDRTEHQAELCGVSGLDPSIEHTIVIEYDYTGYWHNRGALAVDYFLIDVSHEHPTSSSSETTSFETAFTSMPHGTIQPSPTPARRARTLSPAEAALIVAFTITAVIVCLFVCVFFIIKRRRATRRRLSGTVPLPESTTSSIGSDYVTAPLPSPFILELRRNALDTYMFPLGLPLWKSKK